MDIVVYVLEVDKQQMQRHESLPSKLLQPSYREHNVQGSATLSEPALLFR